LRFGLKPFFNSLSMADTHFRFSAVIARSSVVPVTVRDLLSTRCQKWQHRTSITNTRPLIQLSLYKTVPPVFTASDYKTRNADHCCSMEHTINGAAMFASLLKGRGKAQVDLGGLGQSTWDLLWTKWRWDRFFSEFFGFTLSASFHRCSILIYHLGDEQQARWWPQFRPSPYTIDMKNNTTTTQKTNKNMYVHIGSSETSVGITRLHGTESQKKPSCWHFLLALFFWRGL
jgi:hypothetical protein